MDCTTGYNSVTLEYRDQDETINNGNCCDGGVTNDHVVDQQQINKATTSCSNPTQEVQQPSPSKMMAVNKGKRTKRQRLHISYPSSIPSSNYNHQEDDLVDEEQLNVAKCLILLAQGQSRPPPSVPDYQSGQPRGNKRRRRSYSSSSLSLSLNLTGVYECKTCNRTFPSFQALGGHRASHKKLNITSTNSHLDYSFSHEYNPINSTSPFSLQLGNINYRATPTPTTAAVVVQSSIINNNIKSSNKIHECSICAAEFSSGQALGGHMRRHRGPVIPLATTNANTALSLSTAIIDSTATAAAADGKVDPIINNNTNGFLSPDLNLPASPSPESDTKFSLPPKQQPAAMALFSSPALVDCFY